MAITNVRSAPEGGYLAEATVLYPPISYVSEPFASVEEAKVHLETWLHWYDNVAKGDADTIYYILAVPQTWLGPGKGTHRYSGLHVKIGRTNDVRKRVANLRTGTADQLIVHAIEPGDSKVEAKRHKQFESDRRQGEWFRCSPALVRHIFDTWKRNNLLPPEDQQAILALHERIQIYQSVNESGTFDMVNPSLNEDWRGRVFVDLVHALPNGVPLHIGGKRKE